MPTIPADDLVSVIPSVLNAGGNAALTVGLLLSSTAGRVPLLGTDEPVVLSFPSAPAVGAYFGLSSYEYTMAVVYFGGFNGATALPESVLFAQYNTNAVSAFIRGGNASQLLPTLQELTNTSFEIQVDGFSWKSTSINLSSDTSLSAVAATLQSDLVLPGSASVTASLGPTPGHPAGGSTLTVTAVASGTVAVGQTVAGSGVLAGSYITGYGTGTGGTGTYFVNLTQTVGSESMTLSAAAAAFTASIAATGIMTVTAIGSGVLQPGLEITSGAAAGTSIVNQLSGTIGGDGTYTTYPAGQTVSSTSMTAAPAAISVTYDSVSGGFVITSGITGPASSVVYAHRNLASTMLMTQATGAVLSQGAAAADPIGFMEGVVAYTQNWATFTTCFDPDGGTNTGGVITVMGNTQKQLFAQWANSTNNEYAYVATDADPTPTESTQATGSLGYILELAESSGTIPVWSGTWDFTKAAFICGWAASLNFEEPNGRATLANKWQPGLVADVTSQTVAANLRANSYNFYGAWATASQQFLGISPGSITGEFEWADSYVNQIWLNGALQQALMDLLFTVKSIPYNQAGNSLIRAACLDPINAALNFGAIETGITLSAAQAQEVNNSAAVNSVNGQTVNIASTLTAQGYYLQIAPTPPQVRQARGTPPCTLWYTDGGSVQSIDLASIDVQ